MTFPMMTMEGRQQCRHGPKAAVTKTVQKLTNPQGKWSLKSILDNTRSNELSRMTVRPNSQSNHLVGLLLESKTSAQAPKCNHKKKVKLKMTRDKARHSSRSLQNQRRTNRPYSSQQWAMAMMMIIRMRKMSKYKDEQVE